MSATSLTVRMVDVFSMISSELYAATWATRALFAFGDGAMFGILGALIRARIAIVDGFPDREPTHSAPRMPNVCLWKVEISSSFRVRDYSESQEHVAGTH